MENPFEKHNQLNELLHKLDERGLIISLAAFAEESLGELISAFMRPVKSTKHLLDGFNAPLGTFSARIHAAYALGLVTRAQFRDLEHLRRIRNEYSHSWKALSFKDQHIVSRVKALGYSSIDDNFPETEIEKVRSSLSALLIELKVTAEQIQNNGRQTTEIGNGLIAGVPGGLDSQLETCRAKFEEIYAELDQATGERLEFYKILHRRWVFKFLRVISHAPKEQEVTLLEELSRHVEGGYAGLNAYIQQGLQPRSEDERVQMTALK